MAPTFFERPNRNLPYEYPSSHWERDAGGHADEQDLARASQGAFVTPIPKPKKRRKK